MQILRMYIRLQPAAAAVAICHVLCLVPYKRPARACVQPALPPEPDSDTRLRHSYVVRCLARLARSLASRPRRSSLSRALGHDLIVDDVLEEGVDDRPDRVLLVWGEVILRRAHPHRLEEALDCVGVRLPSGVRAKVAVRLVDGQRVVQAYVVAGCVATRCADEVVAFRIAVHPFWRVGDEDATGSHEVHARVEVGGGYRPLRIHSPTPTLSSTALAPGAGAHQILVRALRYDVAELLVSSDVVVFPVRVEWVSRIAYGGRVPHSVRTAIALLPLAHGVASKWQ